MESPFPLSISPAFLSYFEKLFSSISYFSLSFGNQPLPLLVDSTRFLVISNRSPFCLLFPSILNLHRLTSLIPSFLPSLPFHFKPTLPYFTDSIRFSVTYLPYFCLTYIAFHRLYCTRFLQITVTFY